MKIFSFTVIFLLVMQSYLSHAQWAPVPSGTDKELFSICFSSDSIGYVVGRDATVLKSIDGGDSWNPLNTGLSWERFHSVFFLNDSVGFVTGGTNGKVLKTIDGGSSWSIHLLPTNNDLNDIRFINDSVGLIVGYREIWKTTDQGITWVSQYANQELNYPVFYSIEFINEDTVFIAGVDGEYGRILKTTDGGNHWTSQAFSQWMRFDVKFVNDSVGFNVGSNSDIYKTIDAGETWTNIADPGFLNNKKLFFLNETVGYTAGYNGRILSTKDGGQSWSSESTGTTMNLRWVEFINESRGFAVGDSGIILTLRNSENMLSLSCPEEQEICAGSELPDYRSLASVSDDSGEYSLSQSPAPGTLINEATPVTLTATDGASNESSCSFMVHPLAATSHAITEAACGSFSLNEETYSESGVYTQTLTNAVDCDSVLTINLTIDQPVDTSVSQAEQSLTANATTGSYQWVDCSNNYSPIPNETSRSFEPAVSGEYAVIVSNNTCSDTSACYNFIVTSLDEQVLSTPVKVFPNPGNGVYTLEAGEELKNAAIKLVNVLGRSILEERHFSGKSLLLDISNQPNGVYLLEIHQHNKVLRMKLLKN